MATGVLIGNLAYLRVNLKDGRWLTRKVPAQEVWRAVAAIFETGMPLPYPFEKGITTIIPPTEIRSVVMCDGKKSYDWYYYSPKSTREVVDRGVTPADS